MTGYSWSLDEHGFEILSTRLEPDVLAALDALFEDRSVEDAYGIRNLLRDPELLAILRGSRALSEVLKDRLGESSAVRLIYFDKPFRANWSVPWHQDLTIAVKAKHAIDGFRSWTFKSGVAHVQPPETILERMVTIRIHLDAADAANGALLVVPGSHQRGRIAPKNVPRIVEAAGAVRCDIERGGIMLMRPLLLHSSRSSESGRQRRVLHFECSTDTLPPPLEWQDRVKLAGVPDSLE